MKSELPESVQDEALLLRSTTDNNEQLSRFRLHTVLLLLLLLLTGSVFVWSADPPPTAIKPTNEPTAPPTVHLRPYKDTSHRLPVLPSAGPSSHLGFAHIYVLHDPAHPWRLLRMTHLLQLLSLSAEFVPLTDPFLTRMSIYRDIRQHSYTSALILDDSVDMELNIRTLMHAAHQNLPRDWDMFFPGHCGAFEGTQDTAGMLRVANMPICLHAHAVSLKGAHQIVNHVKPSQEIIEMAIMRLKERGLLHMYSLDVPVFTPRPDTDEAKKQDRPAGNKRLEISALTHLSLWQGKTQKA
ncbi:hypothetical protein GGH94_005582 [Coemansia aciculifera]|uniref:Uncharacterized protein n=1 Tax=Coemansia aciculifera TaxID=417176 RepID=A0A9W8IM16_9FUNG|nr:hypothetical protein GGH94_005582 [Coemansia aciculifera]KAJ2870522.1 hypothetical protein GGH93_005510 [Coemansia aciculifera]